MFVLPNLETPDAKCNEAVGVVVPIPTDPASKIAA